MPTGGQPRALAVSAANPSLRVIVTSSAVKVFMGAALVSEVRAHCCKPTGILHIRVKPRFVTAWPLLLC